MAAGDLEARRKWIVGAASDVARDVEQHRAIEHEVGRKAFDAETAADAARCRGRGLGVDAAEELEVAADVADGVDGRGAVLAAEVHDLRRPRDPASWRLAEHFM